MRTYHLPIVIEHDQDGYYVECPALQGCFSQGDTYEEAMTSIYDAVKLHLEDRLADKEPISPDTSSISLSMVDVAV
jgi:predicted RNase H-like HicB family nuclease